MHLKRVFLSSIIMPNLIAPNISFAASQSECSIWLCLPAGFPSGCGAAKSAMNKRLRKGKSPLPSFSSCIISDQSGSEMSYRYSYAAAIYHHTSKETRYLKGKTCGQSLYERHYDNDLEKCIGLSRYIDVFIDGKQSGNTYYW